MNCLDFEKLVVDVAEGRLVEAAIRKQLTTHAKECGRCAARLAFERSLTGHLKTLTASDSMIKAPEGVKRELIAAFAERRNAQKPAAPSLVRPMRRQIKHRTNWTLAAAAVLLTISATAGLWLRVNQRGGGDSGARPQPTAAARPIQTPPTPTILALSVRPTVAVAPTGNQKSGQIQDLARHTKPMATQKKRNFTLKSAQETEETATDYLPLTAVAQAEPTEMQQVVRVEVPRSMLVMLGLPVNADRTRTSIKADLVIGEDGVARAIRLVN